MKKSEYAKPEMIIEEYEPTDVLTASKNTDDLHSTDDYTYGG